MIVIAILIFTKGLSAQNENARFERIGVDQGLSSRYTTCIHQDKYGFIWIGTQFGLNLYDGYEFNIFNSDSENPKSLPFNYVYKILEGKDSIMWICTDYGLSRYNRAAEDFTTFYPDTIEHHNPINSIREIIELDENLWINAGNKLLNFNKKTQVFKDFCKNIYSSIGITSEEAETMFLDDSKTLWFVSRDTNHCSLCKFNPDKEVFRHFFPDQKDSSILCYNPIMSMVEDQSKALWLATYGYGLLKMPNTDNDQFENFRSSGDDLNSIISDFLFKVFKDKKGNIWVGGKGGFSKLYKSDNTFLSFLIPYNDNLKGSNLITDITEDKNGILWLNSWDGIFSFDPLNNDLEHFRNDPHDQTSLSGFLPIRVLADNSQQNWIIAYNNGISRLNQYANSFLQVQNKINDKNTLSHNHACTFLLDKKGYLWVGTFGGGLNRTRSNEEHNYMNFEHCTYDVKNENTISSNFISALFEDKKGDIWIGTFGGLNKYKPETDNFTRYQFNPDDPYSICDDVVLAIFEDNTGTFWIGTPRGLNILDRKTGKFYHFFHDPDDTTSLGSNDIRVIYEDKQNDLWYGGYYLKKLVRRDTSFITYRPDPDNPYSISDENIWAIQEDKSKHLWLGTSNGLNQMNKSDETFTAITKKDGLPENAIAGMCFDDHGHLWISSISGGLSKYNPETGTFRNFDEADGLVDKEYAERSYYKDKDGWMYFGGYNGFNVFHPDSIKENKYIPPVFITAFYLFDEKKYFEQPIFKKKAIRLKYNENEFSFDFVALNYINSQKNQYAYMLEGYDDDWNYCGNQRFARYTNMSPGNYVFRLKGSNNDGYWNEEGASISVIISPPWWETWWAYALYILAIGGTLFWFYRFQLNRQLALREASRLKELDKIKSQLYANITHEFRTPLTVITGMADEIRSSLEPGEQIRLNDFLDMIKRNAGNLLNMVSQMLDLSKLESGKLELKPILADVVPYLQYLTESFQSYAESRGIKLVFYNETESVLMDYDPDKLFTILSNLLSNAIKFTPESGKVICHLNMSGKSHSENLILKIKDTGIGIPADVLPHIFNRFYQIDSSSTRKNEGTGIGLSLSKELVELMKGSITVKSQVGKGSEFTVSLPVTRNSQKQVPKFDRKQVDSEISDKLVSVIPANLKQLNCPDQVLSTKWIIRLHLLWRITRM
nr:hypothetical protein [Bacteroidota bacterium]